jgi:N-methylhydantoinase B
MRINPLTLAVVRGGIEQIAEEMDITLKRTAFSPVISEANDMANGFYHPRTGEVIAQGRWGLPTFIGVMQFTAQAVIKEVERLGIEQGDVFFVNDPYSGGTHLMDAGLVKPFFYRDEFFVFMANRGHWPDMGGSVPGGFGSQVTEVYQEGLRIPPVKLYRRGELNEAVLKIIMANVRVPDDCYGDLMAHLAAFNVGERRLTHLLDKYGKDMVWACMEELKKRSERQMRTYLRQIPDGTYSYEEHLDSDGVENEPLTIGLTLTIRESDAYLDFSNSSPPCRGPMNSVISSTKSACYLAFKHLFPDIPVNSGCFRPLHIHVPKTTFLNATLPRPVAGCAAEVSQRVADTVMGAMGRAVPELVSAGIFGSSFNHSIGGMDPERGPYVVYMFMGGGYGGHSAGDGLSHGAPVISVARSQPAELYELRYPIRIHRFAFREESCGAGKHRGGLGFVIETELLGEEAKASFISERGKFGPKGMLGGHDAAKTEIVILRGDERYIPAHITKDANVPIRKGDRIRISTPGGGGYGNPLEREVDLVIEDVRNEFITRETAKVVYGVVFKGDTLEVDKDATAKQRQTLSP